MSSNLFSQTLFIRKKYQNRSSTSSSSSFPSSLSQVRNHLKPSHQAHGASHYTLYMALQVYGEVLNAFFQTLLPCLLSFKGRINQTFTVKTREMIQIKIKERSRQIQQGAEECPSYTKLSKRLQSILMGVFLGTALPKHRLYFIIP